MAKRSAKSPTPRQKSRPKTTPAPKRKVGRPPAKHSSPDFAQMSIYVHKDVRSRVKIRLFETGGEFSGLVESLLKEWLAKQK